MTVDEATKAELTREFLAKIDQSDAVYIIAVGGYAGVSVCIEVGYAVGQGKTVVFSEPPREFALRALVDAVVPVEQLGAGLLSAVGVGAAD